MYLSKRQNGEETKETNGKQKPNYPRQSWILGVLGIDGLC